MERVVVCVLAFQGLRGWIIFCTLLCRLLRYALVLSLIQIDQFTVRNFVSLSYALVLALTQTDYVLVSALTHID